MSQIVPFESGNLPAFLRGKAPVMTDLTSNVGTGFGVMSIKGKNFTLVKGGDRIKLMNPNEPDEVATSIQVVLLKANAGLSKVWYANGYVEGSAEAPECFSHDGVAPDPSAEHKQASKCVSCPKNIWGSKISEAGKKLKACSDSRRVAIANLDAIDEPILLRVPAATLKPLADYGQKLAERQAPYNAVVTKIGFDADSASPKLTFKAVSWLTDTQYAQVETVVASDAMASILGVAGTAPVDDGLEGLEGAPPAAAQKPAPAPVPKAAPKPAAKAAPAAEPAPKPTPAPAVTTVVSDDLESELDAALGALDD